MRPASPRLLRYRLVESIVPLAADGEALVRYCHARGNEPIDEVVADFVDWGSICILPLMNEGYLTITLAELLDQLLSVSISAIRHEDERECEDAVKDPEWEKVRRIARQALQEFRALGVSVPELGQHLLGGVETVPESEREPSDLLR